MESRIVPAAPEGSRLEEWEDDGTRRAPSHSNIVTWVSPNERFSMRVEVDDPIQGYLIRLYVNDGDHGEGTRIGQAVVDDEDTALDVAAQLAAAADNLEVLEDNPNTGPEVVYKTDAERNKIEQPEEWDDQDEWNDAIEEAYEKADIPRHKGTLTQKEIDGRQYYYLQWREGDQVVSQYVAPVNPA